jgi:hypothetical protein
MLWVTRSRIRVNRAATGWLVRRFIDPAASFRFVEPNEVRRVQQEEAGIGFDAPGARYPHKDSAGRCSFEALAQECRPWDAPLRQLARIVHWADFPDELNAIAVGNQGRSWGTFDRISLSEAEHDRSRSDARIAAIGLRTISFGFPLVAADDHETLDRSAFLYDALYASLGERQTR